MIALAAMTYPTAIRSTGIGWALGLGRTGSIVGPLIVGALLGWKWNVVYIFMAMAIPELLAAGFVLMLSAVRQKKHVAAAAPS